MTDFPIGSRVRMVQTRNCGEVVGPTEATGKDGGLRVPVLWDNGKQVGNWHPDFLRFADTDPRDDPDRVTNGELGRQRGYTKFLGRGIVEHVQDGFFKV